MMIRSGIGALSILSLLVVSLAAVAVEHGPSGVFVDDDGNVHEADIEFIANEGVTRGCNPPVNDEYCPSDAVTRGQMAAFLVRALDLSSVDEDVFDDDDGSVFEKDINALASAGITRGCNPPDNDLFCPDDPVSRAQMAAFLNRALPDLEVLYPEAGAFVDVWDPAVDTGDPPLFYEDIVWLAQTGITRGCNPPENTRFCPSESVERDQMASFLARALRLKSPDVGSTTSTTTDASTSTLSSSTTSSSTSSTSSTTSTTVPTGGCDTDLAGVVAYWCFDDESNPTSEAVNGTDAMLVGGAGFVVDVPSDVPGNVAALSLRDATDYAWASDPGGDANLDDFSAMTLAAWIILDSTASEPRAIVAKYASGGPSALPDRAGVSWGLDVYDDELRFVHRYSEYTSAGAALPTDEWTHVAGVWDGSDVTLYADGEVVAFGDDVFASVPDNDTPVTMGSFEANASGDRFGFFDGLMDEVYVFDEALSPADIARLAGGTATADWHADVIVVWGGEGGNTRHTVRWTPGLGFEPSPLDDVCLDGNGGFPTPQQFPYEVFDVTYSPGVSVRFDFVDPLAPVHAYRHLDDDTCLDPDGQGGGGGTGYFEFDIN